MLAQTVLYALPHIVSDASGKAALVFGGQLIHGSGPNRTTDRSRRTLIGHYVDEATTSLSHYYHPVHNAAGQVVSNIEQQKGGGPCGGDGVH